MGRYLSLTLRVPDEGIGASVVAATFASGIFAPVAVAGIEAHDRGDHWYLAGFALEDFIARFVNQTTPSPASLRVEHRHGARSYLAAVEQQIRSPADRQSGFSPFEVVDQQIGVTKLTDQRLEPRITECLSDWLSDYPAAVIYVYGCFRLAVAGRGDSEPDALRMLLEPDSRQPAVPLVLVRIGPRAGAEAGSEVLIFSQASIWLRRAHALNGRIGPNEAEENLRSLARVVGAVRRAVRRPDVELQLDGRAFTAEYDRLAILEHSLAGESV